MEWNEEVIGRLRALWAEGLSTAEIGRRMAISKNAVVGKAHRLNLPSRPSPIRRGTGEPRPVVRRVVGPTLPPLPAHSLPTHSLPPPPSRPIDQPFVAKRPEPRPIQADPEPARPTTTPALRAVAAPRFGRSNPCCWPLGEPGTPSFRFCDADSLHGKPYCTTHAQIAYVKIKDRREEAAA
jgi:GcrA cell cycle regulator